MDEAAWDAMAVVGRVARAHGNRGHVIVNPETDFPESRFRAGAVLWMRREGRVGSVTIAAVRFHQGRPILELAGVGTMTEAEFYLHDLVGCRVTRRDGTPVGTVLRVEGDRAISRLVVDTDGGEVLVPLAVEICVRIDPAAGEIVIEPPDGLLDLNRVR